MAKSDITDSTPMLAPCNTNVEYMEFVETDPDNKLQLFKIDYATVASETELVSSGAVDDVTIEDIYVNAKTDIPILDKTPGTFRLLAPHQDLQFASQRPFFFQDDTKTFFVIPKQVMRRAIDVFKPNNVDFAIDTSDLIAVDKNPIPDMGGPVINPIDSTPSNKLLGIHTDSAPATMLGTLPNAAIEPAAALTPLPATSGPQPMLAKFGHVSLSGPSYLLTDDLLAGIHKPLPLFKKEKHYHFEMFYHPYVCQFIRQIKRYGIDGLLNPPSGRMDWLPRQLISREFFDREMEGYAPTEVVDKPYPVEDVDFSPSGAYSLYNWEVFFHAPLLIAEKLSMNQHFEAAWDWIRYMFDQTETKGDVPKRYWKTRPFFENPDDQMTVPELMELLSYDGPDQTKQKKRKELEDLVHRWEKEPFKPHLLARLLITPYQKMVFTRSLENVIAWGDQLFRRETIESINQATLCYILAAESLGKWQESIPEHKRKKETFNSIKDRLDAFSNTFVQIENAVAQQGEGSPASEPDDQPPLPTLETLYFCIPQNEKLLDYWNTVTGRLFNIRHGMNIEGAALQLPLFEPPLDPMMLVKAAAAGVDISSVLNDMNAPLPHYRFTVMLQKAIELCSDVKSLGAALLSALEKKDGEELARLRSGHELTLLNAVREVKKKQIEEAKANKEGLEKAKAVVQARHDYYQNLIDTGQNEYEKANLTKLALANNAQERALESEIDAKEKSQLPNLTMGVSGSFGTPVATATIGGVNLVAEAEAQARRHSIDASHASYQATRNQIMGGYLRRKEEWVQQLTLALRELDQIQKQIDAAGVRLAIAEQELSNHEQQIENAKEVDVWMRYKFTNQELYNWMVSQISAIYFQGYQLAYDCAKRAERCFRFERGLTDSSFIQFGYWDSLKNGLLAGEKLHHDLKRMEMAYLDQNKREYEITRPISLVLHDPIALIALKETGQCFVDLPEALFDMDYPGHYMRRTKNVSLTIPCVTGPYTTINCTLTLLSNKTRIATIPAEPYAESEEGDDKRFVANFAPLQSIATSHGQNDSGLFELNFRDERYLPFEGAGVISRWQIEMRKECNAFDFDTISDVIIKLSYTARDGGELLRSKAREAVIQPPQEDVVRMFSARHEFPSEWYRFLHPKESDDKQTLSLGLTAERFPFQFRGRELEVAQFELFLNFKAPVRNEDYQNGGEPLSVSLISGNESVSAALESDPVIGGMPHARIDLQAAVPTSLELTATEESIKAIAPNFQQTVGPSGSAHHRLNMDAIDDIFIVSHYSVSE